MKCAFALLALLLAAPLCAEVVAIRAGTVIDPARNTSAKDQVILVENAQPWHRAEQTGADTDDGANGNGGSGHGGLRRGDCAAPEAGGCGAAV